MSSYSIPGVSLRFEEGRCNEIDKCNETLTYFTSQYNEVCQQMKIRESLARYYRQFENYKITDSLSKKLIRASEILPPVFQKFVGEISSSDVFELLQVVCKYMLLNELELTFLVVGISALESRDLFLKTLGYNDAGYIFERENLSKKSPSFKNALYLSLLVSRTVKEKTCIGEELETFVSGFPHLLVLGSKEFYQVFRDENPKLEKSNLIELNEIHKKLSAEPVTYSKTPSSGKQCEKSSKVTFSTVINSLDEVGMKPRKVQITNEYEDILDYYLNIDDGQTPFV